jgi:hypothetical protein
MSRDAIQQNIEFRRRAFLAAVRRTGVFCIVPGAAVAAEISAVQIPPQFNSSVTKRKSAMPLSLEQISDRLEIQELLTRYCYAVDDRDWNAYRSVFTADAVIDDTVTGGVKSGVEEHITYMKRALSKIVMSQHAISTMLFDIKGNEASTRAHCSCPMLIDLGNGSTQVFFQGLWYRDRLIRTPNGWRIKELVEEGYWNHNVPPGFKF